HTCCALVTRDVLIQEKPELVDAMSALVIAADDYINENPDRTAEITAQWLFGGGDMTFGDVTVNSVDVLKASLQTMKFTTKPSEKWVASNHQFIEAEKDLGYITGLLKNTTTEEADILLFDFAPYERARAMVDNKSITTPSALSKPIALGYLPSDHDAPIFVMIKEWKYFEDTYGIALKPREEVPGKVDVADLVVNGKTIAEVKLVRGEGGGQLMTLMASDAIQFADVGTPPAIAAIDKGTPIKILHPIQTEGSGFVIASDAPASDWDSFIEWVKQRSSEGNPVTIASPLKGSIQDVQIKYALQDSGVVVKEA
ncbi:MAG TPA: ABC transporter substrate-binding protein, partial [Methanoregulaceae archaeon]|nr:ABC transporter substrate-binding protein [Methanoregulaceae archaeon]